MVFHQYRCVCDSVYNLLETGVIRHDNSNGFNNTLLVHEGLRAKRALQIAGTCPVVLHHLHTGTPEENLAKLQRHLGEGLYSNVQSTVATLDSIRKSLKKKHGSDTAAWADPVKEIYSESGRTGGLKQQFTYAKQGKTKLYRPVRYVGCSVRVNQWHALLTAANAKIHAYRVYCDGSA